MDSIKRAFIKGMGSFNLFPPASEPGEINMESAWRAVGDAFQATGDNMRKAMAMYEQESPKPVHPAR
ncbi:MAG: hypothetical protein LBK62_12340 [Treponema sp.]|jgi:hypothetical protein|nr:hypothetical protein [Treponema sp.]